MKKEKNKMYTLLKTILCSLLKILYSPKVIGKENIPEEGPVIFAGNHRHSFDPLLVIMSTKRIVHFLAKKELFKGLQGRILLKAGLIRVDRKRPSPGIVKRSINILNNNGTIGIFPEGTRNKTDEELLPFKFGAVSMAQKTNAPIIPFAIKGKYRLFGRKLVIEFGKTIYVETNNLEEANDNLRNEILNLFRK